MLGEMVGNYGWIRKGKWVESFELCWSGSGGGVLDVYGYCMGILSLGDNVVRFIIQEYFVFFKFLVW